jgi:hypothetical protein
VSCGALTEEGTRPHIVSIETLNLLQTTQEAELKAEFDISKPEAITIGEDEQE